MNAGTLGKIGASLGAVAIVAGVILYFQNFDAEKIACEDIASARAELQAQYDAGISASVQIFASEREMAEERLSQCLSAKPVDPCADLQQARDTAVKNFFAITSPADDAPYSEFQVYFKQRDDAYNIYKKAKEALEACRSANPPKGDVPYEQSDTKACFDEYDASMKTTQETFDRDTQSMRAGLKSALASLDAREKACNPPTGDDQFTSLPETGGAGQGGGVPENILKCELIDANFDTELFALTQQASALESEIQSVEKTISNAQKRINGLEDDLREADTYIPPESTKTQFEGALNALRGQRKASIQSAIDFYQNLVDRKQTEKSSIEQELKDVQAKIEERLNQIQKENQERQRNYPTALHQSKPDECKYYHCHGTLCGIPDPKPSACGHGTTSEQDVDCKAFVDAYLKAAGAR